MNAGTPKKIAVLLSGGVDSSVALAELRRQYDCDIDAYYLKIWLEDDLAFLGECPWEEDLKYARAVCDQFDVPLHIVPLQAEYWDRVVQYTISELKVGRTPSPDIFCNQRIKYGAFIDKLRKDYDRIASGHYVSLARLATGEVELVKGVDPVKDQSYFLSHMSQEQLQRCEFPLGQYSKQEVRRLAASYDLPTQSRPDSQGICFLGKIKYNDFVRFHLGERPGEIRELATNKVLGEHHGYWFHTIGQRKGLGLSGGPWFVVKKDVTENIVYVAHETEESAKGYKTFALAQPHWIRTEPNFDTTYMCKLRHGPNLVPCSLSYDEGGKIQVSLDIADRGLAPGQFCVVYDGATCLGGGSIDLG